MRNILYFMVVVRFLTFGQGLAISNFSDSTFNQYVNITKINLMGNKTTRNWIIERELTFAVGDSMTTFELLNRMTISKQNLTNTSLFNFVDIRYTLTDNVKVEVFILVTERWYLWPVPVFQLAETNFNSWWENKDFSRINYGLMLDYNNFRGRGEKIDLTLQFGFTEKLALGYTIPYINRGKSLGLSLYGSYGQNHEVNYTSINNKRIFYKEVEKVQLQNATAGFDLKYRRKFFSTHIIGAQYSEVSISDSILKYNAEYLGDGATRNRFIALSYRYILDKRDNRNYPLTGNYVSTSIIRYDSDQIKEIDLWWGKLEYKNYTALARKLFLANMIQGHFYLNEFQPYHFRDGLGYNDKSTVRAYELYVIDGQQMFTGKMQLKYQLKAPTSIEMPVSGFNRFSKIHYSLYLGIFGDAGFANDAGYYLENNLANDWQFGYGFSFDLATYYDMVFRMEYSFNKFGENGLFLHFVAPI